MAEYIEREKVLAAIQSMRSPVRSPAQNEMLRTIRIDVNHIPAADVAPVRHGHWTVRCYCVRDNFTGEIDEDFYLECSECRRKVWDCNQTAAISGDFKKLVSDYPFCHCGAKMEVVDSGF